MSSTQSTHGAPSDAAVIKAEYRNLVFIAKRRSEDAANRASLIEASMTVVAEKRALLAEPSRDWLDACTLANEIAMQAAAIVELQTAHAIIAAEAASAIAEAATYAAANGITS